VFAFEKLVFVLAGRLHRRRKEIKYTIMHAEQQFSSGAKAVLVVDLLLNQPGYAACRC
jgi:hypothetical protein